MTAAWPTCHTCGQPLPARAVCRCGHPVEVHDIHRHGRRGACSRSEGPHATPCGCRQYEGAS